MATEARVVDEGVPLTPKLRAACEEIADHLDAIRRLFKEPVKVTLIVRNPAHPSGSRDVFLSSDHWPSARAAAEAVQARPESRV